MASQRTENLHFDSYTYTQLTLLHSTYTQISHSLLHSTYTQISHSLLHSTYTLTTYTLSLSLSFNVRTRHIGTAGVKTKPFRFVVWDRSLPSSETSNFRLLFITSGTSAFSLSNLANSKSKESFRLRNQRLWKRIETKESLDH